MCGELNASLEAVRRGEYEVLRDDGPAAVLLVADLAAVLRGAHLHRHSFTILSFLFEINTHLYLSHPRQLSVMGAGAVQDAEAGAEAGEPENKKKE